MLQIIGSTYEIIRKIGAGGGGNIYLAKHLRLGIKVVLKADKRKTTTRQELLRREVDVLKELHHPYIPGVYDYFTENGITYTAMDYIEGESLDKPLKRGERFSQPQVIAWAIQLLDALSYLHSPIHGEPPRGYIHSDIKPSNLMLTPQGNICLIDFNISLAVGEDNLIGCSPGYASPEHYGYDYSLHSGTGQRIQEESIEETVAMEGEAETSEGDIPTEMLSSFSSSAAFSVSEKRRAFVDVRSDIYSVGATLYHLLSGARPAKNVKEVVPLSDKEFSPAVVKIITKAMNPDPDCRYQTAQEMRQDFLTLRTRDNRLIKWEKNRKKASVLFPMLLAAGIVITFIGYSRIRNLEESRSYAQLAESTLEKGDAAEAIDYAVKSLPEPSGIFTSSYVEEGQKSLAAALGVYDLSDGFKPYKASEMPEKVSYMTIAPDGKTAAALVGNKFEILDTETGEIFASLPAEASELSEAEYLDEHTLIYAGDGGIRAYDIKAEKELWAGNPATSVSISDDGTRVAAIYKDGTYATIYDALDGEEIYIVDFTGKHQSATVNKDFANTKDNFMELNADGSLLGVSFADGSIHIINLNNEADSLTILDTESGYTHFEGGFQGKYFAFSASDDDSSMFAVIDMDTRSQTGGFDGEAALGVQADENGIYVQADNVLSRVDPVTCQLTSLATVEERIRHFSISGSDILLTTEKSILFFTEQGILIEEYQKDDEEYLTAMADGTALVGGGDSGNVRILKYEDNKEEAVFSYDVDYVHTGAKLSADGEKIILFSDMGFRLYDLSGRLLHEENFSEAENIYMEQFVRDGEDSWLNVIYEDGFVQSYGTGDGTLQAEEKKESPDEGVQNEFYTDVFRIEALESGGAAVYERKSNEKIREIEIDEYLVDAVQAGDYAVLQFITEDGDYSGILLNKDGQALADLPDLCDVAGDKLLFDYDKGDIRESSIYSTSELLKLAEG